jgi:large subunit ribosomal protein L6
MSRVGKMPIALPKDVEATVAAELITIKGPLGTLTLPLTGSVKIHNENGTLTFEPANDSREANAMSGTVRALVNNMINGVTKGF